MQIFNLLAHPELWDHEDTFKLLQGLQIHDQPMGSKAEEIIRSLKLHFGINDTMKVDITAKLNEVLGRANAELSKHFKSSSATLFIAGIDDTEGFANQNLGGVSGYAWPNIVFLFLNPDRSWEDLVFRTALHEFNHCQRFLHHNPYASFLGWLIFEGLAECFESEVSKLVTDDTARNQMALQYLPQIQQFWNEMPSDAGDWFFGKVEKNIPFALGYRIGSYLVSQFRQKNSGMPWSELVRLPSSEFLKQGDLL
jgi:uncharacterized protein YjaZ